MSTDHPFQPGARVAIEYTGWASTIVREGFVEKVYAGGNFLLKGDTARQQWRPSFFRIGDHPGEWTAYRTGEGRRRERIRLWTPDVDAEIQAGLAEGQRRDRIRALREKFERLKPDQITEAQLDQIEAALP